MLDKIKEQIERIKNQGATYVDTRWYPFEEVNYLMMWNGNLRAPIPPGRAGLASACFTRAPGAFPPLPI